MHRFSKLLRSIAALFSVAAVAFPVVVAATGFLTPIDDGSQASYENLRPIAIIIIVSGALSLSAFLAALVAFFGSPPPRLMARKLECLATSLPFVIYCALTAAFYIVFNSG